MSNGNSVEPTCGVKTPRRVLYEQAQAVPDIHGFQLSEQGYYKHGVIMYDSPSKRLFASVSDVKENTVVISVGVSGAWPSHQMPRFKLFARAWGCELFALITKRTVPLHDLSFKCTAPPNFDVCMFGDYGTHVDVKIVHSDAFMHLCALMKSASESIADYPTEMPSDPFF